MSEQVEDLEARRAGSGHLFQKSRWKEFEACVDCEV